MAENEFELRMKDVTLLSFVTTRDAFGDQEIRVTGINDGCRHLLPWGLEPTGEGVLRWMQSRALPQNRRFAETLCASMGIAASDVTGIYELSMGLSLNDSFWTPRAGADVRFRDVNLFDNGFSEVLAAVAYAGAWDRSSTIHGMTPELTTSGALAKAWRVEPDGSRALYKGSTPGWVPGEPLSEALAWRAADVAGMRAVPYSVSVWDGTACSVCRDFCTPDVSYVPFGLASASKSVLSVLASASSLGTETMTHVLDMLCLDALICNNDRHFGNFGLLRHNDSGEAVGFSPIFDCGRGFLPMVRDADLGAWESQANAMRPAFGGGSFDEMASRLIGERQQEKLRKLKGLDLADAVADCLPMELRDELTARARVLQPFFQSRLDTLLAMRPVDPNDLVRAVELGRANSAPVQDEAIRFVPGSAHYFRPGFGRDDEGQGRPPRVVPGR